MKGGYVECVHPQHERPGFCSWLLPHTPMNGVHQHMQCVLQNVCDGCGVCVSGQHPFEEQGQALGALWDGGWCQGEGGPHSVPHCSGCMSDTTSCVARIPCGCDAHCCEHGQWQSRVCLCSTRVPVDILCQVLAWAGRKLHAPGMSAQAHQNAAKRHVLPPLPAIGRVGLPAAGTLEKWTSKAGRVWSNNQECVACTCCIRQLSCSNAAAPSTPSMTASTASQPPPGALF